MVFDLARRAGGARAVEAEPPHRLLSEQARGSWGSMRQLQRFAATGAGTLATRELEWSAPLGRVGRAAAAALARRRMLAAALALDTELRRAAEAAATGGSTMDTGRDRSLTLVVAAALLDGAGGCSRDCGATSLMAMRQQHIDPNEIDTVLVTHLHGDHLAEPG